MSREIAIRVPSEIGSYVREQPGSASETVLMLASNLYKGRQHVTLADPGAGEDRLKIRLDRRVLRFIRRATHSKDATAAVRKLLLWGYEGRALPAAPSRPMLGGRRAIPALVAPISLPRPSPAGESWEGVQIPTGLVPAHPSRGMALASWQGTSAVPSLPASECPPQVPAPVSRILEAIPERVLVIGLPIALLVGAYFFLKWLSVLGSAGKVAGGVAAASVAPSVAVWTPQAATGLGALFL